jgi:hypothetical protein
MSGVSSENNPCSAADQSQALEALAERLFWKMEMLDPGLHDRAWADLTERERAFYRHSVRAIFQERELARAALG